MDFISCVTLTVMDGNLPGFLAVNLLGADAKLNIGANGRFPAHGGLFGR
jgi:hypothetical protein